MFKPDVEEAIFYPVDYAITFSWIGKALKERIEGTEGPEDVWEDNTSEFVLPTKTNQFVIPQWNTDVRTCFMNPAFNNRIAFTPLDY
jgi:hypothetical protein